MQDGSKLLRWKLVLNRSESNMQSPTENRMKARLQDERWSLEGSGICVGASHGMTDQQKERERQRTLRKNTDPPNVCRGPAEQGKPTECHTQGPLRLECAGPPTLHQDA